MICTSCKEAGRLNGELVVMQENDQLNLLKESIEVKAKEVEEAHKLCANFFNNEGDARPEPTSSHCDCHHRVGAGHINRDSDGNAVRAT